jgi:hypothetical protein
MITRQASQETMRNSFTIIVGKYEGRRETYSRHRGSGENNTKTDFIETV